jgi:16S rRNA processing protein RimM
VDTPERADQLVKRSLYLPLRMKPKPKGKPLVLEDVIGFEVFSGDESLGKVSAVNPHALNPLLVLGGGKREILIPVNDHFVHIIDYAAKSVHVRLPEGFLDI